MSQLSVTTRAPDYRPHAGRPPGSRDADVRRILAAAWAVLKRSHFRSLKIRQVLIASNTSASNFYRLFPSKSHLLLALLEDEIRLVDRQLRARIDPADSATEQLRAWLAFNIGNAYHRARAERARMFLDQDLLEELPEQVRLLFQLLDNRLSDIIRQGMRDGEFRAGDTDADATMVRYLVRGLLADGLANALPHNEEDLVSTVHDFILRALRTT